MARMIRCEGDGPIRIDPQDKPVFICNCGLTRNAPFCDGAHSAIKREEAGTLYVYDDERLEVVRTEADPKADGGG
ncbi:MAG: CDGSH iron-sulfur domain-containing protein [Phycisphaerales bacterium]